MMIESRQAELDSLYNQYATEPAIVLPMVAGQGESVLPDTELLAKISRSKKGEKFKKLFKGQTEGYESHSEADLALCSILAFWTSKNAGQMDRIFRLSKLYRPKWDEQHGPHTYGQMTLQKALEGTENVLGGNQTHNKKEHNRQIFELVQAGKIEIKRIQWLIQNLL